MVNRRFAIFFSWSCSLQLSSFQLLLCAQGPWQIIKAQHLASQDFDEMLPLKHLFKSGLKIFCSVWRGKKRREVGIYTVNGTYKPITYISFVLKQRMG